MVQTINLNAIITDITIDEQSSATVMVTTIHPDGTLRDITGGVVTWKAAFNGVETIKKDSGTMQVMSAPQTISFVNANANAGQKDVVMVAVSGFGYRPNDGWPIADFAPGDIVNIADIVGHSETNVIDSIDTGTKTLTMVNPLANTYDSTDTSTVAKIVSLFSFQLLPGDTILPATKTYGTPIIWDHMAQIVFPASMSPENMWSVPTTIVAVRGRMFISPILDMS